MKALWVLATLVSTSLAISIAAAAQETPAPAKAGVGQDEVVVIGRYHRDRAMNAFLHGDFAAAETGFQDNLGCVQRIERMREASLQQMHSDAITASTRATAGNGDIAMPQMFDSMKHAYEIADRTCDHPEWQLYMIGLSQIQLGKFADAKRSLYRVTRLSNEDLLFDAHFRIGLLELLDGNIDGAERRLTHLNSMQRHCKRRGARCEVHADLDLSSAYLERAIADARRGRMR